jgi:dTDP-4-dehydrorhamnose 3,5-epimerase
MTISTCGLEDLKIITPKVFGDSRGFFFELWNRARFEDAGMDSEFVQDNVSFSKRGILRGLHFQNPNAQAKLVSVLQGEVYDVAVDLRRSSATFGKWFGLTLSSETKQQFFIPPGFAHGFQVLSETALFHYKCSVLYSPKDELTLAWDDPQLAIPWPIKEPILSDKDKKGVLLRSFPENKLFP